MCECVRARAGKRVVYVCVGREMEDRGFPCVCVRAHVCVGEADSAVCVCVLGRDMKDGERVFQRQNLREFAWGRKRYFGLILFSNHHN